MAPPRRGGARGGSATGYIKTFNYTKGWGFIICDEVDRDVFFHAKNCADSGPEANIGPEAGERLLVEFQLDLEDSSRPRALSVRILPQGRRPERDGSAGGADRRASRERWDRGRPWSGSRGSRSRGDPRRRGAPQPGPWRERGRDGDRGGARGAPADGGRGGLRGGDRGGRRCSRSPGGGREACDGERGRDGGRARALDEGARPPEGGGDSRPPLPRMRRRGSAQTASPSRLALRRASPPSRGAERTPRGERLPARPPPPARSLPRRRGCSRSRSRSIQRNRDRLPPRPPRPVHGGAAARGAAPAGPPGGRGTGPLPGSLPVSWEAGGELGLLVSRSEANALGPIERMSSGRLRFEAEPPKLRDHDPDSRALRISSSSGRSLRDAIHQVLSELERGTRGDQELQVRLLVQRWLAKITIGKGGNNIKDLCRGSGTSVRIDEWAPDGDEVAETVAHVRGPAGRVLGVIGWIHQTALDRQDSQPAPGRSGWQASPPRQAPARAAARPRPSARATPERRGARRPPSVGARSASPSSDALPRGRAEAAGADRRGVAGGAAATAEGRGPPRPPAPWRLEEHPDAPGEWYYLNTETGVTTWELPDDDAAPGMPPTPPSPYRLLEHPEAPGEWYYLNEETGDTFWELPKG